MRIAVAFAATLLAAVVQPGVAAPATRSEAPTRPALARPAETCLDGSRLFLHAAYLPTAQDSAQRCGHLLSTDTLLTIHRWDHT